MTIDNILIFINSILFGLLLGVAASCLGYVLILMIIQRLRKLDSER